MAFKVGQITLSPGQTLFNVGVAWLSDKGAVYVAPSTPAIGTILRFSDFRRSYEILSTNPVVARFWYTITLTNEGTKTTTVSFEGGILP